MGSSGSSSVKAIRPAAVADEEDEARAVSTEQSVANTVRRKSFREDEGPQGRPSITVDVNDNNKDHAGDFKELSQEVVTWFKQRNSETLAGSLAFVPWILQEAFFDGGLEDGAIVMHRGEGAVVFSDASGFTALTERLAMKSNGAELLSQCLHAFFTPLINLINSYRGDVIKFSGDALTIYFPAVDDTKAPRSSSQVPPHGSFGLPDLGPMATAVLRASACCIEIHKRLHMFDVGVDGVRLCLHIGVGCGTVTFLQVGGAVPPETHVPRFEYIIAGNPIEQISVAEPLAKNGETCLSPQAWEFVKDCVVEDRILESNPEYHLLLKMDESKYTFPTVKYSAMERDTRHEKQFQLSELNVIRRYIPSAVFKQIEGGTLTYVNEMRNISTIFISGSGVDVSADAGAQVAQNLMFSIQQACYSHEGTLNKFVIDDKGMLFLLVFGLPPLVHTDDPTRAVLSCFEMCLSFQQLQLTGRFGVTTGRAYCGVCGSSQRMEYTVLGDAVNLSARLMANAPAHGILVDTATKNLCTREVAFQELAPLTVKGKKDPVSSFKPVRKGPPDHIGLVPDGTVKFPWYERPLSMSQQVSMTEDVMAVSLKENVAQLCSLQDWGGISKVQRLLGGQFNVDLHRRNVKVPKQHAVATAPADSPFSSGGIVVIEGNTGMGKIELAEHMVLYSATEYCCLPVFGTIGPRIIDQERLGIELLRSTIAAFRHLDPSVPADDFQALKTLTPSSHVDTLSQVEVPMTTGSCEKEHGKAHLLLFVDLVVSLLEVLRKRTPILIVLQLEYGTNLFAKTLESFNPFWDAAAALSKLAEPEEGSSVGGKPVVLCLLVKDADKAHVTVKKALHNNWFVQLLPLSEAICIEYMCSYMQAPSEMLDETLQRFITKLSLGNPLYIRETIDQLLENDHIQVVRGAGGRAEALHQHQDLDEINISSWAQTAMVGNTTCLLESLDPLEAAVLKMSTCFTGPFTLPDLAASACSRWASATRFDYLRLFRAVRELVKREIIEAGPRTDKSGSSCSIPGPGSLPGSNPTEERQDRYLQTFEMRNVLIRKVGGAMVLEAQKKVIKRQALIDRALLRKLPARMDALKARALEPHIPWYYENVLAKDS